MRLKTKKSELASLGKNWIQWMNRRQVLKSGIGLIAASTLSEISLAGEKQSLYVPPEEAPHQRTFMQWPESRQVYFSKGFLTRVQGTIVEVANTIAQFEPVSLLAAKDQHQKIQKLVSEKVELMDIPTEDLWCRDSGPLFAKTPDGRLVVSHIKFNGWGNRQVHKRDGNVATKIAERYGIAVVSSGLVGEAGGVEHDGHGLLMAHESSWVHANRNRDLDRSEIGERLLKAYGAERIIWAPGLRDNDITDYHIDGLARFTGPGRVLMNLPEHVDQSDPFHLTSMETYDLLVDAGLDVEVIPEPNSRRVRSREFVASYANYYVCNDAVVCAAFGDGRTDEIAVDALQRHYPGRDVISLNVDILGEIGGGIHCATQQMPA